jgi:hypothetical protein
MEQAPLIDSALKVILFDNDIDNGRHPKIFGGIFASGTSKMRSPWQRPITASTSTSLSTA